MSGSEHDPINFREVRVQAGESAKPDLRAGDPGAGAYEAAEFGNGAAWP